MRKNHILAIILAVALFSCKKEKGTINTPPEPMTPPLLLKDIVLSNLPSPYYHFEYDANGKATRASFASGLTMYDILYEANRIAEMRNNIIVNKDRLKYFYDNEGRVFLITYSDSTGAVFARSLFTYDGQQLVQAERHHATAGGFIIDRIMTLSYDASGNLAELTDHRLPVEGQTESTVVDRFGEYDDKVNVDGFERLHPDFFEHFFLLPGVQLQKNNPRKETRTGDGINYEVNYTYSYNEKNYPAAKTGDGVFTNGTNIGQHFQVNGTYTYY